MIDDGCLRVCVYVCDWVCMSIFVCVRVLCVVRALVGSVCVTTLVNTNNKKQHEQT